MIQKTKRTITPIILGFLGTIGLFQTLSITGKIGREAVAYSNSFFSLWFGVLSVIVYKKVYEKCRTKQRKTQIFAVLFSVALSFALSVGKYLETVENWNVGKVGTWFNILVLGGYFTPFVICIWEWLEEAWKKDIGRNRTEKKELSLFLIQWLVIFVCWIPVFLAFYPGAFVYDACDEYVQVATRTFTTHHPLAHVLLLGGFVCAGNKLWGSYNLGIALYTICQMLFLSGVFSYTISYIRKKINSKYVIWGMTLFYGCFPVIPMYAVCSAKDAIFTAAFLVVIIKMLQLYDNTADFFEKKGNIFVSILSAVLMMLFRNNGLYAYVVWGVLLLAGCFWKKKDRKMVVRVIMIMAMSVLLFVGCSKTLAIVTKADDSESQEIMTVPIQQMVRTYVYSPETYTEEEKELLFELIPEEDMDLYNARLSDLVKSKFNNQTFNQNKMKYLSLWMKIGLKKPMIYLNAWLMTSYGYWYPDAVINVYGGNAVYTFTYKDSSYFGFETEYPGIRESKFPWLEEQYRRMSLELYQQKVPAVSMLFSPGCLFWVFMFVLCFLMQKGSWDKVLPLCGILMLWLTAVLGPTYLVRYVLILWFALPVLAAETKE